MKVYNTDKLVQIDLEAATLTGDEIVATFRNRIDKMLDAIAQPNVVINFTDVQHISSTFLGEMLLTQMKITGQGGQLCLAAMNKNVRESLTIAGLADNFQFFDALSEAKEHFA